MTPDDDRIHSLLRPGRVWSAAEVLSRDCPVPEEPGVYGFFFKALPGVVPTQGCCRFGDFALLYVGISPDNPTNQASTHTIRNRVQFHFTGNAERSTLRLTLGSLLCHQLGIRLQLSATRKSRTFGKDEKKLSDWMSENAAVTWAVHPEPWTLEDSILEETFLPFNIKRNSRNWFAGELQKLRRQAKAQAV